MQDLRAASIRVILENQNSLGAYMASPNFRDYRFCWLRDGSFIAHAMLLAGKSDSAARFLRWVDLVILRHRRKVEKLLRMQGDGEKSGPGGYLHARYTMDGHEEGSGWPAFQTDGYGAWLWCLGEYTRRSGDTTLMRDCAESVEVTLEYLRLTWRRPCFDCWEENGGRIHPSTLACIFGGIRAVNAWLGRPELEARAVEIRQFVMSNLTADARLPKYIGSQSVDASLLWIATPFGMLAPEDPVMRATVREIEERLVEKGGVKRYPEDTYFGGGQWLLLSCWLGWHLARSGRVDRARELASWVEARADAHGHLAEQDLSATNDPSYIERWVRRSGEVAKPLLWSHAMYLVLSEVCMPSIPPAESRT